MRFMIIGGISDTDTDTNELSRNCILIGKYLAELHHTLVICSPFEDSADYWVLNGYTHVDLPNCNGIVNL